MKSISFSNINKLALPAIIAGIAEPLISLADTAIIGRLENGSDAISAVGNANAFYLMLIWLLAQSKTAISAIVSRHYGASTLDDIKSLIPQAFILNILIGCSFLPTIIWSKEIFSATYTLEGEALLMASDYYFFRALGLPIALATFLIFGVFRGLQNTHWAMKISLIGGGVNIILDLILVHGWDGIITGMGVKGASIASLTAQLLMLVLAITTLYKKTTFRLSKWRQNLHPEMHALFNLMVNLFARTFLLNIAINLANRVATSYGNIYNAANQIAWQLWLLSAFVIDGYSNAANAMAGRFLGENNKSAMRLMFKKILKYNVVLSSLVGFIYLIFYKYWASLFTDNLAVKEQFESVFYLVAITQPINAIAFTMDGIFKGLGQAKFLRNLLFIATIIFFVPSLFMLDYLLQDLSAIWFSFLIWMIVRSILPLIRFRKLYFN